MARGNTGSLRSRWRRSATADPDLLRGWKRACSRNRSVFAGVNLPLDGAPIAAVDKRDLFLHEVNTHLDYLNLIHRRRAQ